MIARGVVRCVSRGGVLGVGASRIDGIWNITWGDVGRSRGRNFEAGGVRYDLGTILAAGSAD